MKSAFARWTALLLASIVAACANDPPAAELERPNVAPPRQKSSGTLRLENAKINPMYRQVVAMLRQDPAAAT